MKNTNNFFKNSFFIRTLEFIKSIYKSKYIFKKIIIFFVIGFFVLLFSFVARYLALNSEESYINLINNFFAIRIVGNTGISFSFLQNASSSIVFFVQSIPILFSFAIIFFSKNIWIDIFLSFIFFGGLSNIIDRGIFDNYKYLKNINDTNAVIDYFQFTFIKNSAVFNLPDCFIVIATIGLVIYLIISFFYSCFKKSDKKGNNNEK